jgi:hypothetical protein
MLVVKNENSPAQAISACLRTVADESGRRVFQCLKSGVIDIVTIGLRRMIYEENFRWVKRQIGK